MPNKYIKRILEANVYDVAIETPLDVAAHLSQRFSNNILLKREDLQPVFSFKLRGAYNKVINLNAEERAIGVITASAGNHAQGLALAAQRLGIKAVIVMPKTTPGIKIRSVRHYGAKVVLFGDTFDEAYGHSLEIMKDKGYTYVHPYDDPDVIAGQGTIAMELLRQYTKPIHALFVPVGGGGLIAGVSAYVKYLRPDIKVIGVESEDSACLTEALKKGRRVTLPEVGLFADGVAVATIGKEPFRIAKKCVDEVITASTDEICAAIKDIFDDTRSITEPAGALAVAGLKKYVDKTGIKDETLIAIDSGANVNFDRLLHISERTELGEKREALLLVAIPEKVGSFRNFCRLLGKRSITEFNYRYADEEKAHVFVGVRLADRESELPGLMAHLDGKGYAVTDISDNEMAKLHIRHLVGGRAQSVRHEEIFRFEFPERPGALMRFLHALGNRWNISLFHYRNHGAAYGRVLVGLQMEPTAKSKKEFKQFLQELGYRYWEETDNPAYKAFLS
ncbi:MAG: threonine ammonia-lyase, biosynthetic [Pseudomonadales bacterium]|nr:threonine ammonia-lyase, biosynthetic [Pseudomonadales bacterium]